MSEADFLPPHLLERLGDLDLIARTVVESFQAGVHRSYAHGVGEEFARHRAYLPGDDLRNLDWRLYGRSDRLYVREYRVDSNLQAYLVVDATRSMAFTDGHQLSKARYATYVAAAFAHLMLKNGDQVGLASWGAEPRLHLRPRHRPGQLHELLRELVQLELQAGGAAADALEIAAQGLRQRGRVVVISDLVDEDDSEALLVSLGHLRARGHEVVVARVLTPIELGEEPPEWGIQYDPDRPAVRAPIGAGFDIEGYRQRVANYYEQLTRRMRDQGIEVLPLSTTTPVERALVEWARTRKD